MKKFLSIMLAILMVVTTVPYAFAAATVASGTCGADGSNVSWELDSDGVLTFSGEGATQDYPGPSLSPIYYYKDDVKKIVVNDGVTRLGTYVCFMFTEVTEVSLPESLVSIGENVFAYFKALESIELPDSLTTIGIGAFQGCAFKSITIPEGVTTIDVSVFQSCQALETVTFHEGLTTIGNSAFYYCDSLKSISIPASVTTIGEGAFELCNSLESVYVPCSWENNPLYSGFGSALIIADHSIEDGVCSACGCDCPHKNITDGKCDSCGTEGTIVTIEMTDSYGDGWNGNAVVIKQFVDGVYTDTEAGTATIEYGAGGTFTTVLPKDGIFALSWLAGDYPSECSFTIAVDGETVYECVDGSTLTDGQMIYVTCEHTSYTDGKCNVCGYECPHSNFDAATGNCTDCETSLAIAKIETGETTTYYQTADDLRTAIENNYADQVITLLADLAIKDTIDVRNSVGTKNTLDLNGHTLICSDPIMGRILLEYGELEITGTGSINIFMSANDEGTKIVVGSGVTLNNSLRSAYGGVLELTNATIPEAGLNVILYSDYWDPTTYNVSDVLKLPADYYFFVDGKAVSSYSGETEGTVLKHAEHSYTYTDNGDGTHDMVCTGCGDVKVDNEAHSGGTATCKEQAKCERCGASYGELDKTNHDETVAYVNGFCPNCDAYEPAKLVNGVYEISNAGQLYWFAAQVDAGKKAISGKLMADIVVNEGTVTASSTGLRAWTPIGNNSNQYTGNFNGNGNTISGLYFNDSSVNYVGLFSWVGKGGTVQNVGVINSYISGNSRIGGVAGQNEGTIKGCYNTGIVSGGSGSDDSDYGYFTGGVVGYNLYGTVEDCYNTGRINTDFYTTGGVVGYNEYGTVAHCYNTGTVSGIGYVGGVVGYNKDGTVDNCYNTGTVTGSDQGVGGVVSYNEGGITNCYNTGTVSGSRYVGGVAGYNLYGTVDNCYNTGTVSGSRYVGGVAGYNNATVTGCYFDSTVYTGNAIGVGSGTATDVEGKSTEQFKSGEVAYLLSQGENGSIWGQTIGTDPAPVFSDAKVYYGYTSCGDTVAKYTNDETISAEKPDHTQKPTFTDNGNGTHSAVYPCCGTTVTEEHDFENDAHQCVCGKMETFTVSWFLSGSLMQSTSTYGQEFTQTFTVPENTHLRIDSVYLANDASVPVNYTYENGVLTIAATDVPAADVYIDCDHNVLVTFHANGGEIIPEDGYPQEGSTDIFPEDGRYWTREWNYGSEICLINCAAVCREGYTFVDWRDASGQVHQVIPGNGNYTLATEDMTFYAQWQCNHTIGGVVFRDNGNGTHNGYCGECDELLGNYVEHPHNFGDNTHKCVCGYACPHDSYTDGVCDNCDYECPHEWGEGVLTRPTFESEGYYTYTCTLCGHSYTEPAKEADTTALNDASMKVTEYIDNDTLTQEARDGIYKSYRDILKNNGNLFDGFGFVRGDLVEEDQPAIDAITAELEKIIADAEEKIASGEYVKADYTEIDEAIDDIEEKLASENVTDEGKAELEEIKKQLEEMKADENTSAADVAEIEKALEDYEEELDKGIEDGTLVEVDVDAIADDVNKKWAEKLEAEGLLDEYEDFINNQKATDEAMATVDEINDFANSLEGTVAENAENIAKLNEMLDSLYSSFENCLRGTHNFNNYEVTSPAKCEINAKETGTCWFCGETDEREIEGTALSHSFTKYEEVTAPECGKTGLEKADCDHGCGATDEREIPALTHEPLEAVKENEVAPKCGVAGSYDLVVYCDLCGDELDRDTVTVDALTHKDEDGDYLCDHGCGHEFEKPAEPDTPDEPSVSPEDCECLCHKDGFFGAIFSFLIRLLSKIFGANRVCDCGMVH